MGDPELLIMDEPTTGLDLGGREQVMRTLSRIGEESSERAVVLVTHRLEEIPAGFDHIAIMAASRFPPKMPPKRASTQWAIPVRAPSSTPVRWKTV